MDGRETGFAEDATRAGYPDASTEWLQQIRGLQTNMGAMGLGDQGQSYLRLPGPDGRMGGALGEDLSLLCTYTAQTGGVIYGFTRCLCVH